MTMFHTDRPRRALHHALNAALMAGWFQMTSVVSAETIHLRGGDDSIESTTFDLRDDGIHLLAAGSETGEVSRVIPWDMVREIDGISAPSIRDAWEKYRPVALELWRARSRLQRGDARLAELLFERHFEQLAGGDAASELDLIIAEGLLRVRLARGAVEEALAPALETIRLRRAGISTDRYDELPDVIDEQLWLVPELPPIRTDLRMIDLLPDLLRPWSESEDPHVRALAEGYAGPTDTLLVEDAGTGVLLLAAAREAIAIDPVVRQKGRAQLSSLATMQDAPPWVDAWSRWFTARSLSLESDADVDDILIELLHIPARHASRCPALASRAIIHATEILDEAGRFPEANMLRRELLVSHASVVPAIHPDPVTHDGPTDGSETP